MHKRIILAVTATISLLFTSLGVTGSQAATAELTYEEFASSANYKEMSRAMEDFFGEMQSKKYMNMVATVNIDMGTSEIARFTESTATAGANFKYYSSEMNLLSPYDAEGKTTVKDYGYVDRLYFGTIETYAVNSYSMPKSTLARLGKPKAKYFTTKNARIMPYLKQFDTASIISSASKYMSAWTIPSQGMDDPKTRYSEVIKTPNTLNAFDSDYTFDLKIPSQASAGSFTDVHSVVTIGSEGTTYSVKVTAESPYFSLGVLKTSINSVINIAQNPVVAPKLKSAVDLQLLADMSMKINNETILATLAKSISDQAKSMAKKTKKKLAPALLVQATKQYWAKNNWGSNPNLKYTVINGGSKLTYKYFKVKSNVCMTLAKSAVKIKAC